MKHFGNGPVILKGKGVNNLDLLVTGNGPFFAQELLVQRAKSCIEAPTTYKSNHLVFLTLEFLAKAVLCYTIDLTI